MYLFQYICHSIITGSGNDLTEDGSKFTQNLYYNTGTGTAKYNGSISSMTWKAGNESTVRGYKFTYGGLDRLLNATYGETAGINANTDRFSENVTAYDKNGNIKTLQRYRAIGALPYFTISGKVYYKASDVREFIKERFSVTTLPQFEKEHCTKKKK